MPTSRTVYDRVQRKKYAKTVHQKIGKPTNQCCLSHELVHESRKDRLTVVVSGNGKGRKVMIVGAFLERLRIAGIKAPSLPNQPHGREFNMEDFLQNRAEAALPAIGRLVDYVEGLCLLAKKTGSTFDPKKYFEEFIEKRKG